MTNKAAPVAFAMERARRLKILGVRRSTLLTATFVLSYVLYLCAGGFVFSYIEGPEEARYRKIVLDQRRVFLEKYPSVEDEALEELLQLVVTAGNRGVYATRNATGEPNWSFGQSVFFSTTVITTIGYGHVTPLSQSGKGFCIFFAVIGIPFTLILVSALVQRLMVPVMAFLEYLDIKFGHRLGALSIRLLHVTLIGSFVLILAMLIPAAIFASMEPEWDYLDAFYYCFISLTTIGLGDYIPGDAPNQQYRPLYKVLTTIYLLFGLTLAMLVLTVFGGIPELHMGHLFDLNSDDLTMDHEKVRLNQNKSTDHRTIIKVSSRRDLDDEDDDDYSRP
ncbi:potassium channel subfamily K member 6-like isoform X1 [Neocloeon triangulifer]|uniref:potassium channel subfamily K member 6-like isoform X1 n=1 Tax=Neocloeon triangulifer TaxID=2078957 RepID=UPI00286F8754|nr:potassium channel subfamily K member 6-like isoform X1 [Neocloeon triangulifer]